jgi:hypothetical protein
MSVEQKQKEYVIKSFYDLLQALRENPDWLDELRSLILTKDLLELPKKFNEFVEKEFIPRISKVEEKVGSVEEGVGRVEERVSHVEERVSRVEEKVGRVEERVGRVEERVGRVEEKVGRVEERVGRLEIDVGSLKGDSLERRVREKAPAYFGRYFRRVRVVPVEKWAQVLEDAVEEGLIGEDERKEALNLDLLLIAKTAEGKDLLLAVEVSYTVQEKDVQRSLKRAEVFSKAYKCETLPVVAGVNIPEELKGKYREVLFVEVVYDH